MLIHTTAFIALGVTLGFSQTYTGIDIGTVGKTGTDFYNSTSGVYTIQGAGNVALSGATSDACHFVYQTLSGDGELIARVASQTNTSGYALAGLMLRQDTTVGSLETQVL